MRRMGVATALLLLAAAGCVTTSKYKVKEQEAAANDARAQEESAKASASEARAQQEGARATQCEAQAEALRQELAEAQDRLAAATEARNDLQAQAAALAQQKGAAEEKSAQYEQLAGSLQRQIQDGQIEISELRDKMTVKLKDKILFPSGSARLSKEGRAALDVVAGVFKTLVGKNVVVAGFTDDVPVSKSGPYTDNWDLSSARAISVVRYLVSQGVPPLMLGAAGFAEFRPVADNRTADGRSENRRIEIALTPADYVPPVVGTR